MDPNIIRLHRNISKTMERTLTETVLNPGEGFHWLDVDTVRDLMATQSYSAVPIYQAQDDEEITYLVCPSDTS